MRPFMQLTSNALALTLCACAVEARPVEVPESSSDTEEAQSSSEPLTLSVGPTVLTTRNVTPPGTSVTITGRGLAPSERVRFTLDGELIGEAVADVTGSLSSSLTISEDTSPGVYPLTAEAETSVTSGTGWFAVRTDFAQGALQRGPGALQQVRERAEPGEHRARASRVAHGQHGQRDGDGGERARPD